MGILSNKKADQADARQVDAFEIVAARVVDVLATAGVVLDERNLVLRASPGAIQFGLVQNRHLIHSALVALVEDAIGQHQELLNESFRSKLVSSESNFGSMPAPLSSVTATSCCWSTTEPRQSA